jgi:hypothetical protein
MNRSFRLPLFVSFAPLVVSPKRSWQQPGRARLRPSRVWVAGSPGSSRSQKRPTQFLIGLRVSDRNHSRASLHARATFSAHFCLAGTQG